MLCYSAMQWLISNIQQKVLNHHLTGFTGGIEQDKGKGMKLPVLIREKG